MTHKFSQWWISVSLTLFVVAFVLLVIILRDQRKAYAALIAAAGDGRDRSSEVAVPSTAEEAGGGRTGGSRPRRRPAASLPRPTPEPGPTSVAAVERGRIASLGGVTALIWLVILVLMVWH